MKKVTSRDIAKIAGVSQSTVSCVLNNHAGISISKETREHVLKIAEDLNYSLPARKYAHKTGEIVIGLMVPNLTNLFYPFLANEIQMYAQTLGIKTILCNTIRSIEHEEYYLNYLIEQSVNGIIYTFSPKIHNKKVNMPVVIIGEAESSIYDLITLDSFKAGSIVAEHLMNLGHKHIAYITSPIGNISYSRTMRLAGIKGKLAEKGLDKNLVIMASNDETEQQGQAYEFSLGENFTEVVLENYPKVTAIIGVNDMVAAGALSTLHQHGKKIPLDIAVCGFDNLIISQISTPKVTTIDHFSGHRGKMAVNIIKDRIENKETLDSQIKINYEPRLIVRGSTEVNSK